MPMTEEREQELRETFDHFDRDGNGQIDLDEFRQLLAAMRADTSDAEAELGFSELDRDGNGTIDFDELVAWFND